MTLIEFLKRLKPEERLLITQYQEALQAKNWVDAKKNSKHSALWTPEARSKVALARKYPELLNKMIQTGLIQRLAPYRVKYDSAFGRLVGSVLPLAVVGLAAGSLAGLVGPAATAAPATASATVADTYAAMSQAAGLTSSGSIAADISLASAVQTGSMPVAAAQSYATAIASGAIGAAEVTAGLAAEYGIGGTAIALDVASKIPTPSQSGGAASQEVASASTTPLTKEVVTTGADMATTTAAPSGMDALFSAMGEAAGTLVTAYTNAEVARIQGTNQPTMYQPQPGSGISTGTMIAGGIGLVIAVALLLAMSRK